MKNTGIPKRFDIKNSKFDCALLENVSLDKIHWHSHYRISTFSYTISGNNKPKPTFPMGTWFYIKFPQQLLISHITSKNLQVYLSLLQYFPYL